MTSLKELQDSFQNAILDGSGASVIDLISESEKEERDVLFGVYSNAYVARLTEFLMNDYEKLHEYLGDEQFFDLARVYIAANPSDNPNGRWFGSKLPEYMAKTEPYSNMPVLFEMAYFERSLNDVFDAREADVVTLEALGQVAPEDWPRLVLTPHPSVIRVDFNTNVADIWGALQNGEDVPASVSLDEPNHIVFYREQRMSKFRSMEYAEAMMWDQAIKEVPFGVLCEMMGTYTTEDQAPVLAASFLQTWIVSEMLADE
ncbi:MAG: HvfC/BufC family peptide modification chaperone [Methyloligellaceae bacterium]